MDGLADRPADVEADWLIVFLTDGLTEGRRTVQIQILYSPNFYNKESVSKAVSMQT